MAYAAAELTQRAIAGVFGGYALAYAFAAGSAALLSALGATRADAVVAGSIMAFIVYLAAIVYAFGARSTLRAWALIGAALAVFGAAAALLVPIAP